MTFEKLVDNIIDKLFNDMLNRGQFIDDNAKQEIRKSWKKYNNNSMSKYSRC